MSMVTNSVKQAFQATVWDYYHNHGRHELPWRLAEPDGRFDAYKITVSEFMLQQTQVNRVIPKYYEFLRQFPTVSALARAQIGDVLRAWSGLGYNRRAKFLHQAAQQIVTGYEGAFPEETPELIKLPGIGASTAGAIAAYAFNLPVIFLETNIRTAYIHHFFNDQSGVSDKEILKLIGRTLESGQPREWYWALMDYGSYLKQTAGNLNRQSKTYAKQSKFHGSRRQIRGQILRLLGDQPFSSTELCQRINDVRTSSIIDDLLREQLIKKAGNKLSL